MEVVWAVLRVSGVGREMSVISPKGMKAAWRVVGVTAWERPPIKIVDFRRVVSDILWWDEWRSYGWVCMVVGDWDVLGAQVRR